MTERITGIQLWFPIAGAALIFVLDIVKRRWDENDLRRMAAQTWDMFEAYKREGMPDPFTRPGFITETLRYWGFRDDKHLLRLWKKMGHHYETWQPTPQAERWWEDEEEYTDEELAQMEQDRRAEFIYSLNDLCYDNLIGGRVRRFNSCTAIMPIL